MDLAGVEFIGRFVLGMRRLLPGELLMRPTLECSFPPPPHPLQGPWMFSRCADVTSAVGETEGLPVTEARVCSRKVPRSFWSGALAARTLLDSEGQVFLGPPVQISSNERNQSQCLLIPSDLGVK